MRKIFALLLIVAVLFATVSCTDKEKKTSDKGDSGEVVTGTATLEETATEAVTEEENATGTEVSTNEADNGEEHPVEDEDPADHPEDTPVVSDPDPDDILNGEEEIPEETPGNSTDNQPEEDDEPIQVIPPEGENPDEEVPEDENPEELPPDEPLPDEEEPEE